MININGPRLMVTRSIVQNAPRMTVIGILHALRDTEEFLKTWLEFGHEVPVMFAKPYSKQQEAIRGIENSGIKVEQLDYATLEGTSVLDQTIARIKSSTTNPVVLIDVGGYMCQPLIRMKSMNSADLPAGVAEVTTYGHNRYMPELSNLPVPYISIARSEIKDVEATFVGESAWLGIDKVFRDIGMSVFGLKVGVVGYGMIGKRVAHAAKAAGTHTVVYDNNPLKLLEARSYGHQFSLTLEDMLQEVDLVISCTGSIAIDYPSIQNAKDGIILVSAGSKANEYDVQALRAGAHTVIQHGDMITEFQHGASNKRVLLLRKGAAINFLIGSCPDQTMDLVFAELAHACCMIAEGTLPKHQLNEVRADDRKKIAKAWLKLV